MLPVIRSKKRSEPDSSTPSNEVPNSNTRPNNTLPTISSINKNNTGQNNNNTVKPNIQTLPKITPNNNDNNNNNNYKINNNNNNNKQPTRDQDPIEANGNDGRNNEIENEKADKKDEWTSAKRKKVIKKSRKAGEKIDLETIDSNELRALPLYKLLSAKGGKLTKAEEEKKRIREEKEAHEKEVLENPDKFKEELNSEMDAQMENDDDNFMIDDDIDPLLREAQQYNLNANAQDNSGPRMVIDADGNLVFDEESFTVKAKKRDINSLKVVDDIDKKKCVGYGTKKTRDNWTKQETDLFYRALRQVGCDFEIIKLYFPGKTRTQVKNKFKKEEKSNPERVDHAFKSPLALDVHEWAKATNHEIPEDFDVEEFEKELVKEATYEKIEDVTEKNENEREDDNDENQNDEF
jgi:hypothetical protein